MWLEGGSPHQNRTEATPSYHHSFIKPYCHPIAIHWIKKELCIKRWGKRCTWSQKEKQRKMENLLVHLRPHFAFALVWIVKEKSPSFFSLFFFFSLLFYHPNAPQLEFYMVFKLMKRYCATAADPAPLLILIKVSERKIKKRGREKWAMSMCLCIVFVERDECLS